MPTRRAISVIVIAELFGTSLWFSANAVAAASNGHGAYPVRFDWYAPTVALTCVVSKHEPRHCSVCRDQFE